MIHNVKFIKPINLFLRVAFILLILIKSRSVVMLLYAYLNNGNQYMSVAEILAGGTLYETLFVFILCIAGFVSTFGISRFKEWGRIILICIFSLFILFNLYVVFNIFNLQIRSNFDSPVVDLSSAYFKVAWHLMLCCVLGTTIYYFTQPNVRHVFKTT